ncbi:MAG: hypothetical protein OES79_05875 [Planctomycetota bacterium]|nr:hypothetical protein [Planctomycetota bacterium]
MNPSKPPISNSDKLQEAVTAYLDGELDAEGSREIEDRLSRDAPFRSRLQRLQQSWDLLEELPRVEADPNFAATTVEVVAVTVREDASQPSNGRGSILLRQVGMLIGATLAACLVGFLVTTGVAGLFKASGVIADADDQLLRDLPVLQHLDKYLVAEDLQFLRALHEHPPASTILDAVVDADQQAVLTDQPLRQRRARVEQMSQRDKHALAVNQQRFAAFEPLQQERLRTFHQQLMQDDQRDELVTTLDAFYHWYKQLAPEQRAQLRGRPDEQRLAYIDDLLAQQEQHMRWDVARQDAQAAVRWLQDLAVRYREQLTRELSAAERRRLEQLDQTVQQQRLMRLLWQRWQEGRIPQTPPLTDQDIARLKESLSPQARQVLEEAPDARTALRNLVDYLPTKLQRSMVAGRQRGHNGSSTSSAHRMFSAAVDTAVMKPAVSQEQLMRFFRERLKPEQQERMKRLPPDQFLRVLRQEYYRSQFGGQRPRPHIGGQRRVRQHDARPFSRPADGLPGASDRPPPRRPRPPHDADRDSSISPPPDSLPPDRVPDDR